jgi:hypothetical protein
MNKPEAIAHLAKRKRLLENRYIDRYPKWTVADYAALCVVLSVVTETPAVHDVRIHDTRE